MKRSVDMFERRAWAGFALVLAPLLPVMAPGWASVPPTGDSSAGFCIRERSDYYAVELVPTRSVPGTQRSRGIAEVRPPESPFGMAVTADGSYVYDLEVRLEGLRAPPRGAYVGWVAPPDLTSIARLGTFDEALALRGRVAFNKFLVIVTLEPSPDDEADRWQGPIVMRGMSRSGLMHTMIGHGPLAQEPCAKYGFE